MGFDPRTCIDGYVMKIVRVKSRELIGRYGFTASDREDIQQDLLVDLIIGLRRFDPARAQRSTFIAAIVRRSIATLIRRRRQPLRDYRRCRESLDRESDDGSTLLDRLHSSDRHGAVDLRIDLADTCATLPTDLQPLARSLGEDTIAEMGRRTGRSRESLRHAVRRVRRHFCLRGLEIHLPNNQSSAGRHR